MPTGHTTTHVFSVSDRPAFNDPFGDTTPNTNQDTDYPVEPTKDLTNVLERIARFLDKNNPAVLATAMPEGGVLSGGISNRVHFEIDGKPVPIYSLLIFTSTTAGITINFSGRVANAKDGFAMTAASIPLVLSDFQMENVTVLWGGTAGTTTTVNGPSDSTAGGVFIYGWTTQEYIGMNK